MTTTVADLIAWMDRIAPRELAEEWDNTGLLMGDPTARVSRVLTTLTVTWATAEEAIESEADLLISHHPIFFKPTRRLVADDSQSGFLWELARSGVAVASPHTRLDNAAGGINDRLAEILGLEQVEPLTGPPIDPPGQSKVVVFTPEDDRESVLQGVFAAGAGRIGNYRECSYTSPGFGTFFGEAATNPTVGQSGRREIAQEQRIEFICPDPCLADVIAAIRRTHSYEEPAFDVYPLKPSRPTSGRGRIGEVSASPIGLDELASRIRTRLPDADVRLVGPVDRPVQRVAIACGAAGDFLRDAARGQADVFITGEVRYHTAIEAENRGIALILLGHHASERHGLENLAKRLKGDFPGLDVKPTQHEQDPIRRPGEQR